MSAATDARERVLACVRRTVHGPRRFGDGLPEFGTDEYERLGAAEQLELCELRAGIVRDTGEAFAGVPPRYDDDTRNPIDRWTEESEWL